MPGTEWLELLCKHIPDRYEHLVRTVGWYSNRTRGERAKALKRGHLPITPYPTSRSAPCDGPTPLRIRAILT